MHFSRVPSHTWETKRFEASIDVMVFDSGVGGLSIVQELKAYNPDLSICFYCDNDGFPYGLKDDSWLLQRVSALFEKALTTVKPKAIVIGCNTASTIVLEKIRSQINIPIIGVVPAIKPAASLTKTRRIGLIATPATVSRSYTKELIHNFAYDCEVISVGSSRLVELAEAFIRGTTIDDSELSQILQAFGDSSRAEVDVIVLGCTHFPLLKSKLEQILPPDIHWIDSGAAIARQVSKVLEENISGAVINSPRTSTCIFTKKDDLTPMEAFLAGLGFTRYIHLEV